MPTRAVPWLFPTVGPQTPVRRRHATAARRRMLTAFRRPASAKYQRRARLDRMLCGGVESKAGERLDAIAPPFDVALALGIGRHFHVLGLRIQVERQLEHPREFFALREQTRRRTDKRAWDFQGL